MLGGLLKACLDDRACSLAALQPCGIVEHSADKLPRFPQYAGANTRIRACICPYNRPPIEPSVRAAMATATELLHTVRATVGTMINSPGPKGSTPLVMAATQGSVAEVGALVSAGANVNLEVLQFDDDPKIGADGFPVDPLDDVR